MLAEASDLSVSVQSNSPRGAGISLEKALCLYACRQVNTGGAPVAEQTGGPQWQSQRLKQQAGKLSVNSSEYI